MTGSTVLVVRVPRPIEDADACIEHIKRGLRDGILVLGADVKYSVETFPPLGAVEVVAEPVPDSGTEKEPPQKELPDIPAAKGVSRPEPKPVEPPERPPEEKPDVPKPTEIKLPLAVGQATPRFAGKASSEKADIGKFDIAHWCAVNAGLDKLGYGGMK